MFLFQRLQNAIIFIPVPIVFCIDGFHKLSSSLPRRWEGCKSTHLSFVQVHLDRLLCIPRSHQPHSSYSYQWMIWTAVNIRSTGILPWPAQTVWVHDPMLHIAQFPPCASSTLSRMRLLFPLYCSPSIEQDYYLKGIIKPSSSPRPCSTSHNFSLQVPKRSWFSRPASFSGPSNSHSFYDKSKYKVLCTYI